ncbi:fimbrial protein [Providencia sp. 21OH12SH02B-Prov]|uniref:fimbrial protein n=1 Tax=Providencia sp. 21OH12SH02B-Prov TaxID=3015951 RepID=UPI0022B6E1D1|nr:fimbrial protein [Providencia sp. 21OH12SH02B-Prov]WBA56464.1 fimbrial protein [Providencia sp. 21OH12SH02B-Prov]
MNINRKYKVALLSSLMSTPFVANAICTMETYIRPNPAIHVGTSDPVSIYGLQFQPAGTTLATSYISAAQMAATHGLSPEQVLFRCAAADATRIFEGYYMFRAYYSNLTPAQNINGIPYWLISVVYANNTYTATSGVDYEFFLGNGISATTAFPNQPNWSKRIGYDVDPANPNFILVKAKHFSGVTNHQIRSKVPITANGFDATIPNESRAFVFFKGPGINDTMVSNGGNGAPHTPGSFFNIGQNAASTTAVNSCTVERNTSNVNLGSHAGNSLPSTPVNFSVTVKCDTGAANIRYGFAPGMENINQNITDVLLLDPNIGSTAKGVAIEILDANTNRVPLLSLSANGGQISNNNNWKPLPIPPSGTSTSTVDVNFSARIVKHGSEEITPGIVRSKATFMLNQN